MGKWGYGSSAEWLAGSGPMSWRRTYPGRADQAAVARRFAASLLADTGRGEEVEFIVSELISNALRYTRSGEQGGWFALEVALTELAYVAVTDLGVAGDRRFSSNRPWANPARVVGVCWGSPSSPSRSASTVTLRWGTPSGPTSRRSSTRASLSRTW
ncbi:MAG: putative anti-sigma regulatory factor, serine/threonine protein kinase [Streptosporangiaceae bacterium]|nr:putative anti-sigma regulatory factor, serine/threonine protein kinase [Streptosporangiaceae bacterium]